MSFNRRRAALACAYCRHRKRRCDAGKPSCKTCLETGVECQYDDQPSQRIDTSGGSREILGRLKQIEALLQSQAQNIATLSDERFSGHADFAGTSPQSHTSIRTASVAGGLLGGGSLALDSWPLGSVGLEADVSGIPPLTIPVQHRTSSSYLLSLPAVRSLIGEYPPDLFFLLESRSPLPTCLNLQAPWPHDVNSGLRVDLEDTDYLVSAFFSTVHPHHPILDEDTFRFTYSEFRKNYHQGPNASAESALCLVVLALGTVILGSPDAHDFKTSPPGMEYMQHALPTLISLSAWSFSYNIMLPQALLLAGIYFAYLVRPLHSWKLIYSASTVLQFQLSGPDSRREESDSRENTLRIFWSCFLLECDRLAELELPRSALQQLSDETSLPSYSKVDSMQSTCFLAEISIRRLLNRVHNSVYPRRYHDPSLPAPSIVTPDEPTIDEISSIGTVCDELHRQLDLWYASIPEQFRPSLDPNPPDSGESDRYAILRIRYFAAKHIIYRPFLLHIAAHGISPETPATIVENAGLCIESCRLYLRNATRILRWPSQYTWTFSLSSLGAIVVLTLASLSPDLRHLLPDIDELQTLTINNVRPWAVASLEAVISILEDLQRKQRILSRV